MKTATKSNDLVRSYLKEIGRVPLLTHEEEILYAKRVQKAIALNKVKADLVEELGVEPTTDQWAEAVKTSPADLLVEIVAGESA